MYHCEMLDITEYFRGDPSQMNKACRICLHGGDDMLPLNTDTGYGQLDQLLMDFANIKVTADHLAPTHICISCKNKLISSREFKMMVHKSDMILKMVIEKIKQDPVQIEIKVSNTSLNRGLSDDTNDNAIDIRDTDLISNTKLQSQELNKSCDSPSECGWRCGRCGARGAGAAQRRTHRRAHHPLDPLLCAICGKRHQTKVQFRRHVARHMPVKRLQCSLCSRSFSEMCALKRHARSHSGQPAPRPHACTRCDKRFAAKASLEEHMRVHTCLRAWECAACGRGFASPRLLRSHARVHAASRAHPCASCGRAFTHKSALTAHTRTHSGDRPYVCARCGKTFVQSSNLQLHMRTHTDARPFWCASCGGAFRCKSALAVHIARRHPPAPVTTRRHPSTPAATRRANKAKRKGAAVLESACETGVEVRSHPPSHTATLLVQESTEQLADHSSSHL